MQDGFRFIVNPIAGGKRLNGFIDTLKNFGGNGEHVLVSKSPGHSETLTKEALKKGAKKIIAVGGDGTVNEVGKAILGTDATMGIIPTGSGNGLARELNISMNNRKALESLPGLREKTIDTGSVNDHPFFCASGVGFDAQVSRLFQENQDARGFGKYIKISVQEYFNSIEKPFELEIEGENPSTSKAWFITVANSRQFGNNAFICPLAKMDDGLLDFALVPKFQLWNIMLPAFQLFSGQIHNNKKVTSGKASTVKILQEDEWVHLDGEPKKLGKELIFKSNKASLKVLNNLN